MAARAFAADELTLKGELVCAKCGLNKPDAKECQDVLLVKDAKGKTTEYDMTKNKVSQESGEACTQTIPATIVGTVSEKTDASGSRRRRSRSTELFAFQADASAVTCRNIIISQPAVGMPLVQRSLTCSPGTA